MRAPQHTQGLLTVNPVQLNQIATSDGSLEVAMVTALHPAEVTIDNARRLVVCWNACDGVETDLIEAAGDGLLAKSLKRVGQQHDHTSHLLSELEAIANADPSKWDADMRDQFREWAQSRARAAIAKVMVKP